MKDYLLLECFLVVVRWCAVLLYLAITWLFSGLLAEPSRTRATCERRLPDSLPLAGSTPMATAPEILMLPALQQMLSALPAMSTCCSALSWQTFWLEKLILHSVGGLWNCYKASILSPQSSSAHFHLSTTQAFPTLTCQSCSSLVALLPLSSPLLSPS